MGMRAPTSRCASYATRTSVGKSRASFTNGVSRRGMVFPSTSTARVSGSCSSNAGSRGIDLLLFNFDVVLLWILRRINVHQDFMHDGTSGVVEGGAFGIHPLVYCEVYMIQQMLQDQLAVVCRE